MMSSNEEIKDSPNDNDSSEDVFQNQDEEIDRISTKTAEEYLRPLEELSSEYHRLPSRSVKRSSQLSNQPPTPSSQARSIDQLEDSTDVDPCRELRNHTSRSSVDAVISSQPNPTTASVSVPHNSNASGAKTTQRNLSPFAASRNADFSSPPERGTAPVNRSLSKNLKETNTPSPEKRSVGTDVGSTPIKRLRKAPDSDLGETGSCRSELSLPAGVKTSYESPTNLQIQQMEAAFQKKEESESLNSPSSNKKRKTARNGSVESKTASDPCLIDVMSPSSATSIVHESPTNSSEVAIRNFHASPSESRALISSRDCFNDSNSSTKHFNPKDLLQIARDPTLLTEGHESAISNESTYANPNLKTSKQKDAESVADASDEEALPNFTPKKHDISMHPTSSEDTTLLRPNNISGKQRERLPDSDASSELVQPDLPVKDIESAVNPLRSTDKTSSSNLGPSSESQNCPTEVFESLTEVKEVQDSASVPAKETESVSNVTQLAIETQKFKCSQSIPLILNPHLPSSCHLPQRDNFSTTDVLRKILDFVKSDKVRIDQDRLDSSTRTSSLDKDLGYQMIESFISRRRRIRERSLSDKKLASRNSPVKFKSDKVRIDQDRLNSSTRTSSPDKDLGPQTEESSISRRRRIDERSLSDKKLASRNSPELHQSNTSQRKIPGSHSKEASFNLGIQRRPLSGGTLKSRNSAEVQAQQNQSNFVARSRSKDTPISSSLSEISKGGNQMTSVILPLSQTKPAISLATKNLLDFLSSRALLLPTPEILPSNESSISRNNPKVQTQRDGNGHPLLKRSARFLSVEASTSRNQPEVLRDTTPYIDVSEGQASTSRYQPIITGGSSFDLLSSRNGAAMTFREIDSFHNALEAETKQLTVEQEPSTTVRSSSSDQLDSSSNDQLDSSSDDQLDSTHDPTSADVFHSGEARESTRRTFEPNSPFHFEKHPEYLLQARQHLLSVLKAIMLNDKEDTLWNYFEEKFLLISEASFQLSRLELISDLVRFLARKAGRACDIILERSDEMTEMYICAFYGKLTFIVVNALIFTLTVSSSLDFIGFFWIHSEFTEFCTMFVGTLEILGDIEDEASRNRVKILEAMIHRLVLATRLAFQLLLMFIGENGSQLEMFEIQMSEEDKMFFRRKINDRS